MEVTVQKIHQGQVIASSSSVPEHRVSCRKNRDRCILAGYQRIRETERAKEYHGRKQANEIV